MSSAQAQCLAKGDYRVKNMARFFLAVLLLAVTGTQVCRAELTELEIESAYVFNFIKFVEWPDDILKKGDRIRLCVIGNDALHATLATLDGRKAGEYELQVMPPHSGDGADLGTCHALYIDSQEQRRLTPILKSLADKPVLTISDIPNFAERGGNIGLIFRENKVLFEINLASVRRAGLQMSSQMLSLATNIFGR
jgi:YfiR/HmsC-like